MLTIIEPILIVSGILFVTYALAIYSRRQQHLNGFWQVWVGKLKDFNRREFGLYRIGIVLLFVGVILRIANLTFG
ncbi:MULTISPECIES: hypothetical protein [Ferrimonas]|uniref:Immunity protein 17 n=1 Tax=Ferrimonas sediminum TaxID=718193 RepID=A0A1G9AEZ0_9GAMM|nr:MULTISPECIES: hypothetical protein [Ferrimonas]USD35928.1 hypothetical protein J8Z22_12835 [Ferrimonas sp. SCSIO 43195]SDK25906.1 hypothetical protein SAMN04488540_12319 [Ferrimonas sediminum]